MENEKYFDVDQFEENVATEEQEEKPVVNEAEAKPGIIRRGWNCVKRNKKKIAKVAIAAGIGIAGFVLGAAVGKKRDNDDEVEDDPVYLPEPEEETDEDEIDEEEDFDSDTDEESEE